MAQQIQPQDTQKSSVQKPEGAGQKQVSQSFSNTNADPDKEYTTAERHDKKLGPDDLQMDKDQQRSQSDPDRTTTS